MSKNVALIQEIRDLIKGEQEDTDILLKVRDLLMNGDEANGHISSEAYPEIIAKQKTVIKARPIQSGELSESELRRVPAGLEIGVRSLEAESGHYKIETGQGKNGYIWPPHWNVPDVLKTEAKKVKNKDVAEIFHNHVSKLKLSQPDAVTCQSTCIAMALDTKDIMGIRSKLESKGSAGDPGVMSWYLSQKLGDRYIFDDNANMSEMRDWLRAGEFLITHGWFTNSGHVVAIDGISIDPDTLSYKFDMSDPWSEFDFSAWAYNKPNVTFYDGFYSALGIYAACVVGQSPSDAHQIYQAGKFDSNHKGAWVHRILPA